MAKITVNADTESKSLEVLVNGQAVPDISDVRFCIYPSYEDKDEYKLDVHIISMNKNEGDGLTTVTQIMAKENKTPEAKPSKRFVGLYEEIKSDSAKRDIENYFKRF